MNEALNNPVKRGRREVNTADMDVGQRGPLDFEDRGEEIIPIGESLHGDYIAELAFNEEPVTIVLNRSSEKHAPQHVQCAVNGKGVEMMVKNKWVSIGWLPVGVPVTIKRKYAEVLARAKHDNIETHVIERDGEDPINQHQVFTSSKHGFSMVRDNSPKGMEWLTRLLAER